MGRRAEPHDPFRAGLIPTSCGPMIAIVNGSGALVRLDFFEDDAAATDGEERTWRNLWIVWDGAAVTHVARQLDEYFAGERRTFDLELAPMGSVFLKRAWRALSKVPYGETVSYGELAARLDPPTSARAMGRANAVNPISVVVPCHRVIGKDRRLTGYGGGLDRKEALLELEGARLLPQQDALPLEAAGLNDRGGRQ